MNEFRRPLTWFASWMIGDVAAPRRAKVADELRQALESGHWDQQSLEELVYLLSHELLCREYYEQLGREAEESGQRLHLSSRAVVALEREWTTKFFIEFSSCLFSTITPSSYYERELQARGLVVCLELLRSQGARKLDHRFSATITSAFERLFQSSQWQRAWGAPLSKEVFHQYQSSYLLCFGAEYANYFRSDRPLILELIEKGVNLTSVASSMASFSLVRWLLIVSV